MPIILIIAVTAVFVMPLQTTAVSTPDIGAALGLTSADLIDIVVRFLKMALGLLGIIAVFMVLIGGFRWMVSGGDEEKLAAAKRTISAAIVGTVIVMLAWALVSFVIKTTANVSGVP